MVTFPPTDADAYKSLGRAWAATVTVVTSLGREQDRLGGFTCTAFLMVSIAPPIVLVSVGKASQAHDDMRGAAAFAVNFLSPEQAELSGAFARPSADRVDIWKETRWRPDAAGVPLLEGAVGAFSATPRELVDAGDHTLVLGNVTAIHFGDAFESLVYHNRGYGRVQRH